ncbi:hypothetical protein PV04_10798 [Phialophora macrospora]|uniref:SET domain-containing protein n=1 Tax=Phialophora macrospora TaxID=1851006 RepID=A0A0D2CC60_9EURO|nr:hypothetical protein PV04_10798 [Phialophora macrospora]
MGQDAGLSAELTNWALSRGVTIDGIAAREFPGKGLGIIALRRLEAGETILKVPTSLLRTEFSVPQHIKKSVGTECSINGLLALDLWLDNRSATHALSPWRNTLPALAEVKSSMPLFWAPEAQHLLPPAGLALLRKQQAKFRRDWLAVSTCGAFPALSLEEYTYRWLLLWTRTFYYTPPTSKPRSSARLPRARVRSTPKSKSSANPARPAEDCLALVPFGDFFNHTAGTPTVTATYSASGYEFVTGAAGPIAAGTELFISYGRHSNDTLLAEYGFILPDGDNNHDAVLLDEVILPLLSPAQTAELEAAGYLGNYVLGATSPSGSALDDDENGNENDTEVVCYRTTTALRLLCMPFRRWKRGLSCGFDDEDSFQRRVNELVGKVLRTYIDLAAEKIQQVSRLDEVFADQKDVLTRRWAQTLALLTAATKRIPD